MDKVYACIDLKSFYASVECVERGLDPLNTNLVVADKTRTEKTICLAVTPSLKEYGLSGRARLFEVIEKVKEINNNRKEKINTGFMGKSYLKDELENNKYLSLSYIVAKPRMSLYLKYSTKIFGIYLKFLSSEDIYVYSIDEVFCDITNYLKYYKTNPKNLITRMIQEVYKQTGITATGGIGTNLYLAKVAMDIVAKHEKPNKEGVRIAYLTEKSYRELLWEHEPLTDFWRVGNGYSNRLKKLGLYTMGDIAECSLKNEDILYKTFGINAELLIDHAWGYEPCTLNDIKNYKPESNSLSTGQVLHEPYDYESAKLIVNEMTDLLVLDLVKKHFVTDCLVLTIGYDIENLTNKNISKYYSGEVTYDHYGRKTPKSSHGTIRLNNFTSSTKEILEAINTLFFEIANPILLVRRINIAACNLQKESQVKVKYKQYDIFTDISEVESKNKIQEEQEREERSIQRVLLNIQNKYGKNAILKGMNLEKNARTIARNNEIGGHSA